MVQRVSGTRQLVSRGRRQDHNIRRLVGTRRHDDAVTALRRTQRVMLPHLDRRTRATEGRKGSGVFQRRLRPLPDLKGRPWQVDRRLAIYNDNGYHVLRARPEHMIILHQDLAGRHSPLRGVTSAGRTVATRLTLHAQHG